MKKIEKDNLYAVFYYENVMFEDLEEFTRYFKTKPDFTFEALLEETKLKNIYNEEEYLPLYESFLSEMKELWGTVKPFTPKEVLTTYAENAEKRYLIMSAFDPETIVTELDADVIDEQTISKKQEKTILKPKNKDQHTKVDMKNLKAKDLEVVSFEYEDTYTLLKIDKEVFKLEKDVAMVKCKDSSSNKIYYLFVESHYTDAIEAIASTMRKDNGEPLSKEEYLAIESET